MVLGYIETGDYPGNKEEVRIVSELMDEIPDAVMDYQVSGNPNGSYDPLIYPAGTDCTTTSHI